MVTAEVFQTKPRQVHSDGLCSIVFSFSNPSQTLRLEASAHSSNKKLFKLKGAKSDFVYIALSPKLYELSFKQSKWCLKFSTEKEGFDFFCYIHSYLDLDESILRSINADKKSSKKKSKKNSPNNQSKTKHRGIQVSSPASYKHRSSVKHDSVYYILENTPESWAELLETSGIQKKHIILRSPRQSPRKDRAPFLVASSPRHNPSCQSTPIMMANCLKMFICQEDPILDENSNPQEFSQERLSPIKQRALKSPLSKLDLNQIDRNDFPSLKLSPKKTDSTSPNLSESFPLPIPAAIQFSHTNGNCKPTLSSSLKETRCQKDTIYYCQNEHLFPQIVGHDNLSEHPLFLRQKGIHNSN